MLPFLRHSGLVIVAALIGVGLAYLKFAKQASEYESTAIVALRATSNNADASAANSKLSTTWYDDLLRSRMVAERAVAEHNLSPLACFQGTGDPAAALQSRLAIRPLDPVGLTVELNFTAARPEETEQVLKSLLDTYRDVLGDSSGAMGEETLKLIKQAREELLQQLQRQEKALADYRASAPKEWTGRAALAEQRTRLAQLELQRDELVRASIQLQSRADEVELAAKNGEPIPPVNVAPVPEFTATKSIAANSKPAAPKSAAPKSPETNSTELATGTGLVALLEEEAELLKTYGERHPKVKSIRARIEAYQPEAGGETALSRLKAEERILLESFGAEHPKVREIREKIAALTGTEAGKSSDSSTGPAPVAPEDQGTAPADPVRSKTSPASDPEPSAAAAETPSSDKYLATLRRQITSQDRESDRLEALIEARRLALRKLDQWEAGEGILIRDLDRTRRLFDEVLKRIPAPPKASDARQGSFVVLSTPKRGEPVRRNPLSTLLLGGGCGAAIGLVLSLTQARMRSKYAISPKQASNGAPPILIHLPSPGPIPPPTADGLSSVLEVYHEPQSVIAEAYRSLRTIINFRSSEFGARHIGLLDATSSEASLIIAANVAASFALTGRKTLLIDCGSGPIRAHQLFGVKQPENLDEALHDRKELADALLSNEIPDLNIAEWQPGPEGLDTTQARNALQAMREKYDVTIVRLPASTDEQITQAVGLVDCLVLLTPPSEKLTSLLENLTRFNESVGSRILGTVIYGLAEAV